MPLSKVILEVNGPDNKCVSFDDQIVKAVVGQAATDPCENIIKLTEQRNIKHTREIIFAISLKTKLGKNNENI